jgi:PAS domain S-box-containing protein
MGTATTADVELDRYRIAYDHIRDIVLVICPTSGRIVEVNREAERAYGYSRDELLARTIFDVRVDVQTAVSEQMEAADRDGIQFEGMHRRRDGTTFPVEVSSRGELIAERRLLLSIVRDISVRRRLEDERAHLLETTRRALALRDEFLTVASHELRTPVTGVSLQLQQLGKLLERGGAPVERLRAAADASLRELERLQTLIGRLLDAQVPPGDLALRREPVDLTDLVTDVAARLAVHAEQVGCTLTFDVPSITGSWDRLRLEQVLTNLLTNAFKYGAGRPVTISARADDVTARLEVRDHGIGIAREDAARIFDKFERAVPLSHFGGLGLGLYISRQIVVTHGGTIELDSERDAGAVFRIILPR